MRTQATRPRVRGRCPRPYRSGTARFLLVLGLGGLVAGGLLLLSATSARPDAQPAPSPVLAASAAGAPSVGAPIASFSVGKNPLLPVLDPVTGAVYVANYDAGNVSVIDGTTDRLVASIPAYPQPVSPAVDPVTGTVYVPIEGTNNVSVVSGTTGAVLANVPVKADPLPLTPVYDPASGDFYVTSTLSTDVLVLSGSSPAVVATIPLPGRPLPPAVDNATGELYVPIEGTGTVSVLDGGSNSLVANLTVGDGYVETPAVDPANGDLYFSELSGGAPGEAGAVAVVSGTTGTVVANLTVGELPETPVVDPENGNIYVANYGSNNLSVISGQSNRVVASIPTGVGPDVPSVDSGNGELYVANTQSNNVTVVSASTGQVVGAIRVGLQPEAAVYDPAAGSLFVANKASNTVTILSDGTQPSFATTFTAAGVPDGVAWSVTLDGLRVNSTNGTASFQLPDGTYSYSVAASDGCVATAPAGTSTVRGSPVSVQLRFTSGACVEWLGLGVRAWEEIAAIGAVGAVAVGTYAAFRRGRREQDLEDDLPPPGASRLEAHRSEGETDGSARRYRRGRRRQHRRRYGIVVGVAALVVVAYVVVVPGLRPVPGPSSSPLAATVVHLGPVQLGVVPCATGPAAIVEQVPWINATATLTTEEIVLVVGDVDNDGLWSAGTSPAVSPGSVCAGALPTPNWTAASGVNVGFDWYVVLSDPNGTNVAYYTLEQGWLPVGAGPWPAPIPNGSTLAFVCNPSVSRLGAYEFEATYHLEVGLIFGGTSGAAIVATAAL